MQYLLITGTTGLVGQYLLRDSLLAERRVAVLTRATRVETAKQRVEGVLAYWEQKLARALPRPVVIEGDLCQPGLGLAETDRQWLARYCESVLHSAASLTFHAEGPSSLSSSEDSVTEDRVGEPYRTNVFGTRKLVEFCQATGIRDFQFVSTAYVCGQRKGPVLEQELDPQAPFGNDYERSKSQAEQLVRSEFSGTATIYRPSIIVGDSGTGYTSTFRGFYTPLHLAHVLAETDGLSAARSFLNQTGLNRDDRKNLVPVDWVSAVVMHILQTPQHHGQTYHLTNPQPVAISDIEEVLREKLAASVELGAGTKRARLDRAGGKSASASPPEDLVRSMDVYRSYLRDDPQFDCSATTDAVPHLPCPVIDREIVERLVDFAFEANFSCPRSQSSTPAPIEDLLRPLLAAGQEKSVMLTPKEEYEQSVQLELTGSGGGAWRVVFTDGQPICAESGRCGKSRILVYGAAAVFCAVAAGSLTLDEAMVSGQLVVELPNAEVSTAERLVQSLLRFVGDQPTQQTNCDQVKSDRRSAV